MRLQAIAAAVTAMAFTSIGIGTTVQAAKPSYLFTVEAASGQTLTLTPHKGEDERFTLSLHSVAPVTKFADRPFRLASVISPAALVKNWDSWFADSPPNAVLTYSVNDSHLPRSVVVTLSRPRYDSHERTLAFTANRTYRSLDPSEKGSNWSRPATPEVFTHASLFIDDAGSSSTDALMAQLQSAMQAYVFSPNDELTWSAITAYLSSFLNEAWQQGTLNGATAGDAYSVSCSATSQQLLNGFLTCSVRMSLPNGTSVTTNLTQTMQTS